MIEIHLEVELRSPTCIAQRLTSPGQPTETLGYLPGTTVRGSIAQLWLAGRQYPDLDPDDADYHLFQRLFLSNIVRYRPAYPIPRHAARGDRTWVVPRTALTAKHNGGWRSMGRAGVEDQLVQVLTDQVRDEMESVSPEFVVAHSGMQRWEPIRVSRRLISRTAINQLGRSASAGGQSREVAAPGQLYSIEALETGACFASTITLEDHADDLAAVLRSLLEDHPMVSLGQGTRRGLGAAIIRHVHSGVSEDRPSTQILEIAEDFNTRLGADQNRYLPITLLTDTLLRNHYLIPTSDAQPATLGRYTAPPPPSLRLNRAIQGTRWLMGWDALRDLPRSPQLAVTKGSVWIYEVAPNDLPAAVDWWLVIEEQGLGERRTEGFGQVRLFHPFHVDSEVY